MSSQTPNQWLTLTKKYRTPDGSVFIRVLVDEENKPVRIFIDAGKNGEVSFAAAAALAAVVGTGLRSGIDVRELWWDLVGHTCSGLNNLTHDACSVADALGRFLRTYFDPQEAESKSLLRLVQGDEQRSA
jgi:hypothetical protein